MAIAPRSAPAVIEAGEADTSRLLDALETYGCALVRGALAIPLMDAVARRANAHFFRAPYLQVSAELVAIDSVPPVSLGSGRRPDGGTTDELLACLAASAPWRALGALYPEIAVSLPQSRLRLARPGDDPDPPFQQAAGGARQRNLGFAFWIPLSACGDEAPSIELVARRAKRPLASGDGRGIRYAELPPEQRSALWSPEMELGDLVIFDPLTPYRDGVRPDMRQTRIAIDCRILRHSKI